jgi:hypothetical protein
MDSKSSQQITKQQPMAQTKQTIRRAKKEEADSINSSYR